jgi:hypothetical protein
MVEVVVPSFGIEVGAAVMREVPGSELADTKLTVALSVMGAVLTVPVIVAVPGDAAEVSVSV